MKTTFKIGLLFLILPPIFSFWFYNNYVSHARFQLFDKELTQSLEVEENIPVVGLFSMEAAQEFQKYGVGQMVAPDFPVVKFITNAEGVKALSQRRDVEKLQLDNVRQLTQDNALLAFENITTTKSAVNDSLVKVVMMDTKNAPGLHGYYTYKTFRIVNKDAEVINIQALDDNGGGTISMLIIAMQKAVLEKPDLICASIGGEGTPNDILSSAVNLMFTSFNIPSIWSAGNTGEKVIFTPANARYAVASIALDETGHKATYSNYGSKDGKLMVSNLGRVEIDGSIHYGTSFSAPNLCGQVALKIKEEKIKRNMSKIDKLQAIEVVSMIINAAKANDIVQVGWDEETGYGHPTQPVIMGASLNLGIEERFYIFPYSSMIMLNLIGFAVGIFLIKKGVKAS